MLIVGYLLGAALMTGYPGVQSQEPVPSAGKCGDKPQPQTTKSHQDSTTEQKSTDSIVARTPASHTKEDSNREEREPEGKTTNDQLITWSTVWLAAVTTALAIFTGNLWYATKRLVEGAKDTAIKQLRAYINVSGARISNRDNVQTVHLEIKNFGQTPAKKIVVLVGMDIGDLRWQFAETLEQATNVQRVEGGVMGPTAVCTIQVQIPPLLADAGDDMEERKKAFYSWGEIGYNDAFDQPHITKFRFVIIGKEWFTNTKMGICHQGNDAT